MRSEDDDDAPTSLIISTRASSESTLASTTRRVTLPRPSTFLIMISSPSKMSTPNCIPCPPCPPCPPCTVITPPSTRIFPTPRRSGRLLCRHVGHI